jgi:hypothetical protein
MYSSKSCLQMLPVHAESVARGKVVGSMNLSMLEECCLVAAGSWLELEIVLLWRFRNCCVRNRCRQAPFPLRKRRLLRNHERHVDSGTALGTSESVDVVKGHGLAVPQA